MNFKRRLLAVWLLLLLLLLPAAAAGAEEDSASAATSAAADADADADATTAPSGDSALKERIRQEEQVEESRFSILPHKPNYLLPVTYNTSPNRQVYAQASEGTENLDNLEVKFQISLKTPLWTRIFGDRGTLYAAYSQLAFWQAYNSDSSSPFREINFEPELFLACRTGGEFLGITSQLVTIGVNHQSNGRSGDLSRSWNRVVADFLFSVGDVYVNLRPWYRLPEGVGDDDNPDIEDFLGYGELLVVRKWREHTLSLMLRNNLRSSENRGAVQVNWSFPLGSKLRGYVQYFNGYGESLVDYNHAVNRFGLGVSLTDWL